MFNKIYASIMIILVLVLLSILSIATISAYTLKIPVCNDGIVNTSCVNINDATGTTNNTNPAILFYQNGNLYLSNDIPASYNMNYYNLTNISYFNVTNITQQYTNITYLTYVMNYSNGSTFVFQPNYSIDNDYIKTLFQQVFQASNWSNFYNTSYINANFESISDINNVKSTLGSYATQAQLASFDARLNNINGGNLSGVNMTKLNDLLNNGGDFSMGWKVAIVIIGLLVIVIAIMIFRMGMGG